MPRPSRLGGRAPPGEAEWEHAAKAGMPHARYPWGEEEPTDDAAHLCNIWQGDFPRSQQRGGRLRRHRAGGQLRAQRSAVDMVGNVWEWCADPFRVRSLTAAAKARNGAAAAAKDA